MYFHPSLLLDVGPTPLEFFLHVTPDLTRLVIELVHLDLGRLLQLIESEFPLNNRGFDHQEFQLGKS